jgi:hypothetical protein
VKSRLLPPLLPLLLLLLLLAAPLSAQRRPATVLSGAPDGAFPGLQTVDRPPVGAEQIVGQMAAGVLGGIVGSAVTAAVLYPLVTREGDDGWGALGAIAGGLILGYPVGATGGVYLAGRGPDRTGSLLATAGGALAGALVGGVLAPPSGGATYLLLVPAGATAGFNLTRRWRHRPAPPP